MEPPGTGIEEVNEELVIGDTEDTGGDVIEGDPKLKEVAKQFKKSDYRSMGRPKGRPKIHSSTREKDLISVLRGEAPDPTTASDTSEEVHLRRVEGWPSGPGPSAAWTGPPRSLCRGGGLPQPRPRMHHNDGSTAPPQPVLPGPGRHAGLVHP